MIVEMVGDSGLWVTKANNFLTSFFFVFLKTNLNHKLQTNKENFLIVKLCICTQKIIFKWSILK